MTYVRGGDTPQSVWAQSTDIILNWAVDGATAAIPGTPEVGVTFVAPTSGNVMVFIGGGIRDSSGINRVFLRPQIYLGTRATGTPLESGSFKEFTSSPPETEVIYGSRIFMATGLTAGEVYYARVVYYSLNPNGAAAATNDIFAREIGVVPL